MPRPTIKVDSVLVHKITKYPDCVNHINESDFKKKVSAHYNAERNKMLFPDEVDYQTMGNRIRQWIEDGTIIVAYEIRKGKRGIQPGNKLSPQHLDAMRLGRKTKKAFESAIKEGMPENFSKLPTSSSNGMMNKWQENMRVNFAGKNILLNGVIAGNRKACVKAMCTLCVGGYLNRQTEDPAVADAIRDCRGTTCPLYIIRPFKEKIKA